LPVPGHAARITGPARCRSYQIGRTRRPVPIQRSAGWSQPDSGWTGPSCLGNFDNDRQGRRRYRSREGDRMAPLQKPCTYRQPYRSFWGGGWRTLFSNWSFVCARHPDGRFLHKCGRTAVRPYIGAGASASHIGVFCGGRGNRFFAKKGFLHLPLTPGHAAGCRTTGRADLQAECRFLCGLPER
jgi:hypothetical protein